MLIILVQIGIFKKVKGKGRGKGEKGGREKAREGRKKKKVGEGEREGKIKPPLSKILATALPTFKVVVQRHHCLSIIV